MTPSFEKSYPNIAYWVDAFGWIEIGADEYSSSFIRVLDEGGMVWESEDHYDSLDLALQATETAIGEWFEERGVE